MLYICGWFKIDQSKLTPKHRNGHGGVVKCRASPRRATPLHNVRMHACMCVRIWTTYMLTHKASRHCMAALHCPACQHRVSSHRCRCCAPAARRRAGALRVAARGAGRRVCVVGSISTRRRRLELEHPPVYDGHNFMVPVDCEKVPRAPI